MVYKIGSVRGAYSVTRRLASQIRFDEDLCIENHNPLIEKISYECEPNSRGGIIVFSEEVNAISLSKNKIINWIKQRLATLGNRVFRNKKIDKLGKKYELPGWTVGYYLHGRYISKDGSVFDEKSLSVEIIGLSTDTMIEIAEDICRDFQQETVLLKDYSSGRVMFIDGE